MTTKTTDEQRFCELLTGTTINETQRVTLHDMVFKGKIISLKKLGDISLLCRKLSGKSCPKLSDLITNPFIFCDINIQGLTYTRCEKICQHLSLDIPINFKADAYLVELFLEHKIMKLIGECSGKCNHHNIICKKFIEKFPNIDTTELQLSKKSNHGTKYTSLSQLDQIEENVWSLLYDVDSSSSEDTDDETDHVFQVTDETPQQQLAIQTIINSGNICVLTGFPGTGKSFVCSKIAEYYHRRDKKIIFTAVSGTAVVNLKKNIKFKTNYIIGTICRTFRYNRQKLYSFDHSKEFQDPDVIFVDEASMVDYVSLASILETAVKYNAKVILIGDCDQLPPIGLGEPFRMIIEQKFCPIAKLDQVLRQKDGSPLLKTITSFCHNTFDISKNINEECQMIQTDDKHIISTLIKTLKKYQCNPRNTMVLIGQNRGELGTIEVNNRLQEYYYPESRTHITKIRENDIYEEDQVLRLVNSYCTMGNHPDENDDGTHDQFNGDLYQVMPKVNETIKLARLRDSSNHSAELTDFKNEFSLGYAITVHKSQGSQFENVIILLPESHKYMWSNSDKRLLYTAITRTQKRCIIIGSAELLQQTYDKMPKEIETGLGDEAWENSHRS